MDYWMFPFLIPKFNPINEKPPTVYAILNSIVNYGRDVPIKTYELAKYGRETIFDFQYPLSVNMNKEEFETMILNKYLMRRIGFDTVTAFKIQLSVKLNEIMPLYNKLFDSLEGWDLFNDGEVETRISDDTRKTTSNNNLKSDNRYSDIPQNKIEDVKNGSYVSDYTYNETSGNMVTDDVNKLNTTTKRSPADKMNIYKEFIENKNNIYTMIFKDLDILFYSIY